MTENVPQFGTDSFLVTVEDSAHQRTSLIDRELKRRSIEKGARVAVLLVVEQIPHDARPNVLDWATFCDDAWLDHLRSLGIDAVRAAMRAEIVI